MSEKGTCGPYGYHIDVDFVTFLQTLGGKNLNKQLKKIQRKRNERLQRSMEYVIDEVVNIFLIFNGSLDSHTAIRIELKSNFELHTNSIAYKTKYFRICKRKNG